MECLASWNRFGSFVIEVISFFILLNIQNKLRQPLLDQHIYAQSSFPFLLKAMEGKDPDVTCHITLADPLLRNLINQNVTNVIAVDLS